MPEPECCPTCKRPFAPKVKCGPVARKVLKFMETHPDGSNIHDIVEFVYREDPDGGPLNAHKVIHVVVHNLNRRLAEHGVIIRATRGVGALYSLRNLVATK